MIKVKILTAPTVAALEKRTEQFLKENVSPEVSAICVSGATVVRGSTSPAMTITYDDLSVPAKLVEGSPETAPEISEQPPAPPEQKPEPEKETPKPAPEPSKPSEPVAPDPAKGLTNTVVQPPDPKEEKPDSPK